MALLPQRSTETRVRAAGTVRCDQKTKHLIPRLQAGDIAVLAHEDLDEMAARGLVEAQVAAVINTCCSMTGRYPNRGAMLLLHAGIPLIDVREREAEDGSPTFMENVQEGEYVTILDGSIYARDRYITQGVVICREDIVYRMDQATKNTTGELHRFLENTLHHASREKNFFLDQLPKPSLRTNMQGKHTLVVVRGATYREDLRAVSHYIMEQKPVLIGVDGGADALLQAGFKPDVIVGDMDSVSDKALQSGAELVVHAYMDGMAPGMQRVERLGLQAHSFPAPGTSEDVAMIIAHELGAELIVALGTHTNMVEFLEKGRKGMASTMLTRLRVGAKLVDAKGVSQLYQTRISWLGLIGVTAAALLPTTVLAAVNPVIRNILRVLYWKIKLFFL